MDNAEVYEGLISLENIYEKIFADEESVIYIKKIRKDFGKNFM